jgi:hypothetical protein
MGIGELSQGGNRTSANCVQGQNTRGDCEFVGGDLAELRRYLRFRERVYDLKNAKDEVGEK